MGGEEQQHDGESRFFFQLQIQDHQVWPDPRSLAQSSFGRARAYDFVTLLTQIFRGGLVPAAVIVNEKNATNGWKRWRRRWWRWQLRRRFAVVQNLPNPGHE